jgi:hypothetical protein
MQFSNGSTYEGDWIEDKMEGEGLFIDIDGLEYEG